jgi:hypothetical protein
MDQRVAGRSCRVRKPNESGRRPFLVVILNEVEGSLALVGWRSESGIATGSSTALGMTKVSAKRARMLFAALTTAGGLLQFS